MFLDIIVFFIILIILTLVFNYSNNYKEGFFNFPDASHNTFVESSQNKLNPLTNTINIMDPAIPFTSETSKAFKNTLGGLSAQGTSTAYDLKGISDYTIPTNMPSTFKEAKSCEDQGPVCSSFDDPKFASNCGISFDKEGTGREGKPHIGGLYVSSQDRSIQIAAAANALKTGTDPYKVYKPTLGKSKPGTFSLSKDKCLILKEKLDCESNKTFSSPNCTQCFTSKGFGRVDPVTSRISSTLFLFGNGIVTVNTSNSSPSQISLSQSNLDPNTSVNVNIPDNAEGTVFNINVQPLQGKPLTYICGYIEGQTGRGLFKLDLKNLIQSDLVTNASPKINGSSNKNGFSCRSIVPGSGKKTMNLSCLMPFSFLNMYDGDSNICENGPVITKAASATFLESDPCYSKTNKPGNYTLECLKDRWIDIGGTPQGTGYPSNKAAADRIQRDAKGQPLEIDTIIDNISARVIGGITGRDSNGNPLSLEDWNTLSMSTRGLPITTPCDGINDGTLSKECLTYLYFNKGINSHIGPTYTLSPQQVASMKGQTSPNTYCQPGTSLDPNTPEGLKFGQSLSGIDSVKKSYDEINRMANDNTKPNGAKASAMLQCYGVTLDSKEEQVVKQSTFPIKPYINFDANELSLGKIVEWQNSSGSCDEYQCSGIFRGGGATVINNGYSKEISIPVTTTFRATTGSGITYPTFTVALVYRVTPRSALFIEHGWSYNTPTSFYMSNGVHSGGGPTFWYTNITQPNGAIWSSMDSSNAFSSGEHPPARAFGQGDNSFIIQIMSVSPTTTIHQYYVVNTGITSTYTRTNAPWGFAVPVKSRNYLNINHRRGADNLTVAQYISNIQIFNQTFTQDQVNDLQEYLLNKYFMNVSMKPTTNWAGRELSTDGRCGAQNGNKACGGTSCCSAFGWCGGTKGQKDDWCWTYRDYNGSYDGQKP
jgi:hypothetical protein